MSRTKAGEVLPLLLFLIGAGLFVLAPVRALADLPQWGDDHDSLWKFNQGWEKIKLIPELKETKWQVDGKWNSLAPLSFTEDETLKTARFQHYYEGIEVIGSWVQWHKTALEGLTGSEQVQKNLATVWVETKPTLSESQAVGVLRSQWNNQNLAEKPQLKILPPVDLEEGPATLIWWLKLDPEKEKPGRDLIIDAHTGTMIADIPRRLTLSIPLVSHVTSKRKLAAIDVYDANDRSDNEIVSLRNFEKVISKNILTGDADSSAQRALLNARKVLNYYQKTHSRNSFDNNGATSVNIVHFGHQMANAFWDQDAKVMAYGDGDGETLRDLTFGLDVAGHEMTHAIVSNTSQLLYFSEPGALNESYADFFGKMIENRSDWTIGKDVFIDPYQGGLRNLQNPHALRAIYYSPSGRPLSVPYPEKMSEALKAPEGCWEGNDLCFVHINSTIPSHIAYMVVQKIGKERTEKLWYAVLTHYLSPRSGFKAMKSTTIQACAILYDTDTCDQVSSVFSQAGL